MVTSIPPARIRSQPYHARGLTVLTILAIARLVIACGAPEPGSPAPSHAPAPDPAPQRIVCVGLELAQLLVELGLSPQVVAADTRSLELPALAHALDVGDATAPSLEALRRARPDLVLVLSRDALTGLEGVPIHRFAPADANAVIETIHRIGDLTGTRLRATSVAALLSRGIAEIAVRRDGLPRLRVVWLIDRDPLVAVGGSGLLHEMLELAGAENAFHTPADARLVVTPQQIAESRSDAVLGADLPVDPALHALPALDLLGRIRALHALLYPPGDAAPGTPARERDSLRSS